MSVSMSCFCICMFQNLRVSSLSVTKPLFDCNYTLIMHQIQHDLSYRARERKTFGLVAQRWIVDRIGLINGKILRLSLLSTSQRLGTECRLVDYWPKDQKGVPALNTRNPTMSTMTMAFHIKLLTMETSETRLIS
jgi:hypothetical protein